MPNDKRQDFFEFDENFREFLERHDPPRPRPRWGRTFAVLGICAAVIAAVATVFGIFRSDDSTLGPSLRQTFPIQSPPPVSRPAAEPATPPVSARTTDDASLPHSMPAVPATPEPPHAGDTGAPITGATPTAKATAPLSGQTSPPAPSTDRQEVLQKAENPDTPVTQEPQPVPALQKPAAEPGPQPPAGTTGPSENQAADENRLPDLTAEIRGGRLQHAAQIYRRYFRDHPEKYSISLEVACQPQTVIRAYNEVEPAGKMFILPARLGERSCFAVLWGSYRTIREARAAKTSVPSFFTSQTTPRVVGLFRYMGPE